MNVLLTIKCGTLILVFNIVRSADVLKVEPCNPAYNNCQLDQECYLAIINGHKKSFCLKNSKFNYLTKPCDANSDLKCQNGGTCVQVGEMTVCVCTSLASGDQCQNWGETINKITTAFTAFNVLHAVGRESRIIYLSNGIHAANFNIVGDDVIFDKNIFLPVNQVTSMIFNDITNNLVLSSMTDESIFFIHDGGILKWVHNKFKIPPIATDKYGNIFTFATSDYPTILNVFNSEGVGIANITLYDVYLYAATTSIAICKDSKILVVVTGNLGHFFECNATRQYEAIFQEFSGEVNGVAIDEFNNVVVSGTSDFTVYRIGVYNYPVTVYNWFKYFISLETEFVTNFWIPGFSTHKGVVYMIGRSDNDNVTISIVRYIEPDTGTTVMPYP